MSVHPTFDALLRSLEEGPTVRSIGIDRTPRGQRSAAVLMLFTDEADPSLTFLTRAETMRRHAGQIALPGGAVDDTDVDRRHTALREANEEVGLEAEHVTVHGELPALWVPASNYDVTTVVATWPGGHPLRALDPREVDAVHSYRVSELASPTTRVVGRHPSGFRGPAFVFGDQFIWGLTAHLVSWALDLAEWTVPWDKSRVLDIPERYMRD
ncbi:MAG TPA: CoA pyrophosphatase [Tessaracoccus flavescens]|uniref:CoA pyrophosphatase n=1 Tax=Tessaracoccus flavescens TaxID=399497 RepID=A0A921EP00_9ACTN|nr:CoA pyrophosphatase [Tessaracoccus flavescens]